MYVPLLSLSMPGEVGSLVADLLLPSPGPHTPSVKTPKDDVVDLCSSPEICSQKKSEEDDANEEDEEDDIDLEEEKTKK